jgi:hypothetical protein
LDKHWVRVLVLQSLNKCCSYIVRCLSGDIATQRLK